MVKSTPEQWLAFAFLLLFFPTSLVCLTRAPSRATATPRYTPRYIDEVNEALDQARLYSFNDDNVEMVSTLVEHLQEIFADSYFTNTSASCGDVIDAAVATMAEAFNTLGTKDFGLDQLETIWIATETVIQGIEQSIIELDSVQQSEKLVELLERTAGLVRAQRAQCSTGMLSQIFSRLQTAVKTAIAKKPVVAASASLGFLAATGCVAGLILKGRTGVDQRVPVGDKVESPKRRAGVDQLVSAENKIQSPSNVSTPFISPSATPSKNAKFFSSEKSNGDIPYHQRFDYVQTTQVSQADARRNCRTRRQGVGDIRRKLNFEQFADTRDTTNVISKQEQPEVPNTVIRQESPTKTAASKVDYRMTLANVLKGMKKELEKKPLKKSEVVEEEASDTENSLRRSLSNIIPRTQTDEVKQDELSPESKKRWESPSDSPEFLPSDSSAGENKKREPNDLIRTSLDFVQRRGCGHLMTAKKRDVLSIRRESFVSPPDSPVAEDEKIKTIVVTELSHVHKSGDRVSLPPSDSNSEPEVMTKTGVEKLRKVSSTIAALQNKLNLEPASSSTTKHVRVKSEKTLSHSIKNGEQGSTHQVDKENDRPNKSGKMAKRTRQKSNNIQALQSKLKLFQ